LNTDGTSPVSLIADPTTHRLKIDIGTSGTGIAGNAKKDNNRMSSMLGTSNTDNSTPITLYTDSGSNLLTKTT